MCSYFIDIESRPRGFILTADGPLSSITTICTNVPASSLRPLRFLNGLSFLHLLCRVLRSFPPVILLQYLQHPWSNLSFPILSLFISFTASPSHHRIPLGANPLSLSSSPNPIFLPYATSLRVSKQASTYGSLVNPISQPQILSRTLLTQLPLLTLLHLYTHCYSTRSSLHSTCY